MIESLFDIRALNEGIQKVTGFLALFPADRTLSKEERTFIGEAIESVTTKSINK